MAKQLADEVLELDLSEARANMRLAVPVSRLEVQYVPPGQLLRIRVGNESKARIVDRPGVIYVCDGNVLGDVYIANDAGEGVAQLAYSREVFADFRGGAKEAPWLQSSLLLPFADGDGGARCLLTGLGAQTVANSAVGASGAALTTTDTLHGYGPMFRLRAGPGVADARWALESVMPSPPLYSMLRESSIGAGTVPPAPSSFDFMVADSLAVPTLDGAGADARAIFGVGKTAYSVVASTVQLAGVGFQADTAGAGKWRCIISAFGEPPLLSPHFDFLTDVSHAEMHRLAIRFTFPAGVTTIEWLIDDRVVAVSRGRFPDPPVFGEGGVLNYGLHAMKMMQWAVWHDLAGGDVDMYFLGWGGAAAYVRSHGVA